MSTGAARAERSWPGVLTALMTGTELAGDDTAWAMDEIMSGNATPAQLAAFAVLLRAKGETPELYSSTYYDAVNLLAWAIGEAASVSRPRYP